MIYSAKELKWSLDSSKPNTKIISWRLSLPSGATGPPRLNRLLAVLKNILTVIQAGPTWTQPTQSLSQCPLVPKLQWNHWEIFYQNRKDKPVHVVQVIWNNYSKKSKKQTVVMTVRLPTEKAKEVREERTMVSIWTREATTSFPILPLPRVHQEWKLPPTLATHHPTITINPVLSTICLRRWTKTVTSARNRLGRVAEGNLSWISSTI